ncbi:MAG TPA: DUF4157 domain-containing protein [Longimicrobium sp.]|nr:DUF4157 domain-containing protein [Longimicrobium sp.]
MSRLAQRARRRAAAARPAAAPRAGAAPAQPASMAMPRAAGNQAMLRMGRGRGEAGPAGGDGLAAALRATRGAGRPLDEAPRAWLGASLGADLGAVRVHTGPDAARLSRSLGAEAFTWGRNLYFGEGRYRPGSGAGMRLLAHEVTHALQQGMHDDAAHGPLRVSDPGDGAEREAERVAGRVGDLKAAPGAAAARATASGTRTVQPCIQRSKTLDVGVYETTDHGTGYEDAPSETFTLKANSLQEAGDRLNELTAAAGKLGLPTSIGLLSFYGHAAPGNQSVGAGEQNVADRQIDNASLDAYPQHFTRIFTPLADGASVFMRGCNAGAGVYGLDMLKKVKSKAKELAKRDVTAYGWTGKAYHNRVLWYDSYEQTGERVSSDTEKPKMTWEDLKKLKKQNP